ncbi:bifunctional 4-hydroxy-2-oxoglutarate aldolase/2-dehydro-3-deoxy-phosphogluconate aldolase [candidate division KSB1 bacterium]|nr:bifunctional 4-hydroxy-2-oxoglutarate aldolase/2-dehydro-3-deoxy-phosphogluconate aldolase [candidate division KSB1 bacterium]
MRQDIVRRIEECGVIAVIRMDNTEKLQQVIEAISEGGVKALEITMTTPGAIDVIKAVSKQISSDFMLGVGTVLDPETARAAILAGAEFVVGPTLNPDVIKMAHRYDKAVFPGAFTPTEILTAWEHGADIVKVFPATALGPKFFKDVKGPLPEVKMTPTGGVGLNNAAEFIKSGAACLGVGTAMLDKKMIAESDWDGLAKLAASFVAEVKKGREA